MLILPWLIVQFSPMPSLLFAMILLTAILAIPLIALLDAYRLVKRTRRDYTLKEYNHMLVYVLIFFIATGSVIGFALQVRNSYMEAYIVPARSMCPTIALNDRVLGNKQCYREEDPQRGDIVVFRPLVNRKFRYIKRVVAVAGDTVEMRDNELYVNGDKLAREKITEGKAGTIYYEDNGRRQYKIQLTPSQDTPMTESSDASSSTDFEPLTVPPHHCFVLGDNRNSSFDSRAFGCVPLATIIARVDYLYWPARDWSRFGRIH
ncbi:MAG: signal peptidase I [Sedimentisphaerales bacterium]|nr:signal peptidase I [Sedimentisphaerales bacterium]